MSSLPFLKNKDKYIGSGVAQVGEGPGMDPMLSSIADELLDSLERKDIKQLRMALQAIVSQIRSDNG